jgi:hypothetical protein
MSCAYYNSGLPWFYLLPGSLFFMLDEGEKGWYSGVDGEITDKRGEKNV